MNRVVIFLFLIFAVSCTAQINVRIKGADNKTLYLQYFTINGYQKIDSASVIDKVVSFPVSEKTPPGMYIIGDGKTGFEFFLNENQLLFETVWNSFQDSLKIISSLENKVYSPIPTKRDKAYMHLDLLNQVLTYYDSGTDYYLTTLLEFTNTQDRFSSWTDSVINSAPKALVSHYIRADIKPYISPGLNLKPTKSFSRSIGSIKWIGMIIL
ncbi:MAG: DUF4369 domain-containing protein [Bacteroidetes bacterium]|nr:DUF4369 domain-containing protein [Bacteroidota bacterium]